jgi:phenylacetate-coenzyme A ligase PaaK-like adenylate-forming protein
MKGSRFRRLLATAAWHAHPAPRRGAYRYLQRSQWLPRRELEQVQLTALNNVLAAARDIPFYRERLDAASIGSEGLRSLAELASLPPLERADMQRLGVEGMRRPGGIVIRRRTSGTTGQPVEVVWPLEVMAWVDGADRRSLDWLGVGLGDRRLYVRGSTSSSRLRRRVRALAFNSDRIIPAALEDAEYRRAAVARVRRKPPAIVFGNVKSTDRLALAVEGGPPFEAGVVVTTAGKLHPNYRTMIERGFDCPVYERYGTLEIGLIAHPCREQGLQHVAAEVVLVEIVREDGAPAEPGEFGEVLVTCLRNRTMPLIRYRVGDLGALADDSCPCGRGLPVLKSLVGRTNEMLLRADGGVVLPYVMIDELMAVAGPGLLEFKIVQQRDLTVEILVAQRDDPAAEDCRRRLAASFDRLIGLPGGTVVTRVPDIPADRAEKLRVVVSHALHPDDA